MLATLWCALNPNLLIMSGFKRWHSWQLPADEMSGNIAWLYYRLLRQLMRVPTIHIPGERYYTSLFQLNNISLQLQSPLCHWSLNEDLGFVLSSLYCWYQLDRCTEDTSFFPPCRPIDLHCDLELFSLMTDGYIPPREMTSVRVYECDYFCATHKSSNLFCSSEIHIVLTGLDLRAGIDMQDEYIKRRCKRRVVLCTATETLLFFSLSHFGPI